MIAKSSSFSSWRYSVTSEKLYKLLSLGLGASFLGNELVLLCCSAYSETRLLKYELILS
jgi:hypothetical protein